MANVTITIPDAIVPRLVAAMRATFPQYAALSDAACFKQVTGDSWRLVLVQYEERAARDAAAATVQSAVDSAVSAGATIT